MCPQALFYPKIGRLAKSFLPSFTTAFYIHNFKGNKPGVPVPNIAPLTL